MSHVDEGTLHAYLDGELATVERELVDRHLKGCPACQARLAEERALLERASRLLGMAAPPERAVPPLEALRPPRRIWHLRRPLAWAATLVLAVGLGWYARASYQGNAAPQHATEMGKAVAVPEAAKPSALPSPTVDGGAPEAHRPARVATRSEQRAIDSVSKDRDLQRQAAAAQASGATTNAVAPQETASVVTGVLAQRKADASPITIRGAPAPAPAAEPAVSAPRGRATPVMSTSWPLIARQPARDLLGVDPVIIPGFAVRAYRRNPATQEVAVEQVTDAGTTISLFERRVDTSADERRADLAAVDAPRAMAKAANERLARFVGPLRVEIEGPLTPDSLSSLLELIR